MARRQRGGRWSGHFILGNAQVIFVGLATMILAASSTTATPMPQGSIRAQLLHREHPLSPLRSPDDMGQAEKLQNQARRSAARSRNLAKRRQLSTNATPTTFDAPVDDAIPGDSSEYNVMISLGTPAQNFIAQVDTGSDLVWLQCAPCSPSTGCFSQSDPVFFPSLSSTYSQLSCSSPGCQNYSSQNQVLNVTTCDSSTSCPYDYTYGSGFTQGNLSSDSITLTSTSGDNMTVPDFWFGCSHNSSADNYPAADGLVGFGQGLISFPSQLGHFFEDKFSYCLVNTSLATVQSSLLVFGSDAGSGPISEALQYTPILSNPEYPTYYYVGLEGILVNGVALNFSAADVAIDTLGNGGTIFDSGSTVTGLVPLVYDKLLAAIFATVPKGYQPLDANISAALFHLDLCYDITGKKDYASVFPSISFKFVNASVWDLRFENSWLVQSEYEALCLAFSGKDAGELNVFGNTQQEDFYVLYDRVNQRIGFVAADCGSMAP